MKNDNPYPIAVLSAALAAMILAPALPCLAAGETRAEASVNVKKDFDVEAKGESKAEAKEESAGKQEAADPPQPEPAPEAEEPGSLELSDAPDGAEVLVNGTPAGTTPLAEPILLEPGTHTITVRKAGHQPIVTVISVEPGDELVMNANLLLAGPSAPPVPPPSPPPPRLYTPVFVTLGAAWYRTRLIALNPYIAPAERIKVIDAFLSAYEMSHSMRKRATAWKRALQKGYEPESYRDPHYMRTRPDVFALRLYGGNYGTGLMIELPTGRWPWFYLGGRITGGGGAPVREYDDYRSWFGVGLHFGVPFSIGKRKLHEIRVGGAAMLGYMRDYMGYSDNTGLYEERFTAGPILAPELSYVVHLAKRFALQIGADAFFGLVKGVPYGSSDEKRPRTMISGFIGFRI